MLDPVSAPALPTVMFWVRHLLFSFVDYFTVCHVLLSTSCLCLFSWPFSVYPCFHLFLSPYLFWSVIFFYTSLVRLFSWVSCVSVPAPWSLRVLCVPALFSVDSDLSSVLYFSLVFISDFPSPSFSFFAFWTLDNSSSLKVAFSCPNCLALCLLFWLSVIKQWFTQKRGRKTVEDRKWRVKHYTQGYNRQQLNIKLLTKKQKSLQWVLHEHLEV